MRYGMAGLAFGLLVHLGCTSEAVEKTFEELDSRGSGQATGYSQGISPVSINAGFLPPPLRIKPGLVNPEGRPWNPGRWYQRILNGDHEAITRNQFTMLNQDLHDAVQLYARITGKDPRSIHELEEAGLLFFVPRYPGTTVPYTLVDPPVTRLAYGEMSVELTPERMGFKTDWYRPDQMPKPLEMSGTHSPPVLELTLTDPEEITRDRLWHFHHCLNERWMQYVEIFGVAPPDLETLCEALDVEVVGVTRLDARGATPSPGLPIVRVERLPTLDTFRVTSTPATRVGNPLYFYFAPLETRLAGKAYEVGGVDPDFVPEPGTPVVGWAEFQLDPPGALPVPDEGPRNLLEESAPVESGEPAEPEVDPENPAPF